MNLRAIIADDEGPARFRVRELLADAGDVEIIGDAGTGKDTLEMLRLHRPDLLFLDVQMPPPTGVALLRELAPECRPCTIFLTAYEDHAVDAFALRAVDYLLKPFTAERFHEALGRAREFVRATTGRTTRLRRLLVRDGSSSVVIPVGDIKLIESANNYVVVHVVTGKRFVLRRTLGSFEADLDPEHFFRTARTSIVNLHFVRAVKSEGGDDHEVILEGGVRAPLTMGIRELQTRLERGAGAAG
jgi:two-component system, LytTR family, response regulator